MLILVGLGLQDHKDLTFRGYEVIKSADKVYLDLYTSRFSSSVEQLEEFLGRQIKKIARSDLEERSKKLIEEAKEQNIVILVPGDPTIATTHISLVLEAKKLGVKTRIINNASIINAVCSLTGLQNYRFGKSATISWQRSRAFIDTIKANLSIDAHTLLFLDLNPPMTIREAVEKILSLERDFADHFAVGIARAGGEDALVKCERLKKLLNFDFGEPLHSLVILARRIHFMEYECLRSFAFAPEELKEWVI
ncbi:MAG: diphthine synthase [Archaeoglobaceae archaeon]|nr:diphthine synthase [Archaeoglobaceae archaeon]MDW8128322.1 diphthine synthase [Archaeoglobaceae archaeon]